MSRYNTAPYKRLQRVLHRPCSLYRQRSKTTHGALQALFLRFAPFNRRKYKTDKSGYNLRHAGAYHSAAAPPVYNRYQRHAGTLYRSAQPPYYNKVYKGAAVRPCYRSMPGCAADRRPCKPGGVSSCRVWIAGKCYTRRTC